MAIYLDSSALVKLVVREPESEALRRYLGRRRPLLSSALARTEVLRALMPAGDEAVARGRRVLQTLELIRINDRILTEAGLLRPSALRSLDAIHLATLRALGRDVSTIVCYDNRLAAAARKLGHRIAQPR